MSDTAAPVALEPGTDRDKLGTIRVANAVVAQIAALAALEIEGVEAMFQVSGQQIDRILRRPVAHRGVRVEMQADGRLHLDLYIVIADGSVLPSVGPAVQQRVADAIDRTLGLELAEVNVFVSEVTFGP